MAVENLAVVHTKIPTGVPVAGEHLSVKDVGPFDKDQSAPANSLVLETLYVSFDPYMRGILRSTEVKSYSPAVPIGGTLPAGSIARVLDSSLEGYKKGDFVYGMFPIQEYSIYTYDPKGQLPKPKVVSAEAARGDLRHYLSALGMPGLTAYSSLYDIGKPKKGETIVISSAAGAVGQLVGAVAKHEGLTVYGSVGSDEKLDYIINELGFDGGWNYKKESSTKDVINRLTNGKGIDIYYDNVGGEQLEGALETLNNHGRIVACGQISQYNLKPEEKYPLRNTMHVVAKRLTFRGFIVSDPSMGPVYAEKHQEVVSKWLREGSFKAKIHEWAGIENGPAAFVGMLKGENFGKAVLKIKDP